MPVWHLCTLTATNDANERSTTTDDTVVRSSRATKVLHYEQTHKHAKSPTGPTAKSEFEADRGRGTPN